MPDTKVDLVPGRLTGYRRWKIIGSGNENHPFRVDPPFRMRSLTAGTVWPWTPEVRANCHRRQIGETYSKFREPVEHDPEDVPNVACSCGIYAHYRLNYPSHGEVAGAIEAWGPTVIGELAFRARHARLLGLIRPEPSTGERDQLEELGRLYRAPIFTSMDEFREVFPASDVSSLLPPAEERDVDPTHFASGGYVYVAPAGGKQRSWQQLGYIAPAASAAPEPRKPMDCHCGQWNCPMNTMTQASTPSDPRIPLDPPIYPPIF